MGTKRFTVLIIPEKTDQLRRLKFPAWGIKAGIIFLASAFLIFILMTGLFLSSRSKLKELAYLKSENQTQKTQIYELASKVDNLDGQLSRLRQFNNRLRVITGLDKKSEDELSPLGIGGLDGGEKTYPMLGNLEEVIIRRMNSELERLKSEAYLEEVSLQDLNEFVQDQKSILSATPSIWPTRGWLTSGFGMRISPFTGLNAMHEGLDIASQVGTLVQAPADGIVSFAGFTPEIGKVVVLDHGYGMTTRYGHLSEIKVRLGSRVKRGETIGNVGDTGRSTGPHLHYEVRLNEVAVNPKKYILN